MIGFQSESLDGFRARLRACQTVNYAASVTSWQTIGPQNEFWSDRALSGATRRGDGGVAQKTSEVDTAILGTRLHLTFPSTSRAINTHQPTTG
jgi:hypothetical protein